MSAPKREGEIKVTIRMPESMHEALKRMADMELRSMHNQILLILRAAIQKAAQDEGQEPKT
jgi:hypothetical protein